MKKHYKFAGVYAGPESMAKSEYEAAAIYACPMEIIESEEENKIENTDDKQPYPLNHADDTDSFMAIYAAPMVTNEPITSLIYAGPVINSDSVIPMGNSTFSSNMDTNKNVVCKICGTENGGTAKFCTECGASLGIFCSCGARLESNMKFCPECGTKREDILL